MVMDPSTAIAAGPSNIPPPIINKEPSSNKNREQKKKRSNKRKRIGSEASTSAAVDGPGDGEGGGAEMSTKSWSNPWLDELDTTSCDNKEQRLHDEIVAFFNYISPRPQECHVRAMLISEVSNIARRRFAKGSVDPFGSVAQSMYLPDGDTDLVITTPYPYDDEMKKRALFQLAALMRNAHVTTHVQVIHRARVPVISFQTLPDLGSLKIDISLNATDGLKAVPILKDYFDRMPALRYLVLCIKSLLSRHDLNTASSGGLSSYGIICLAINFLQINYKERPTAYIEKPVESKSLGALLMDFLDFYGNDFNYEKSVVSPTQGKVLLKQDKGWTNPNRPHSLCIECLLNPDNDVGRPTSKVGKIRKIFQDSYVALQAYEFSKGPSTHNILGAILGISDSTLAHRVLLKDIVDSGRLARALEDVRQYAPPAYNANISRRPQSHSSQQSYSRNYSRPNESSNRPRNSLPPRPLPPHVDHPPIHHSLPPRPTQIGAGHHKQYVAQGPSLGAMRAATANDGSGSNVHPTSSSRGSHSPPRRRIKGE